MKIKKLAHCCLVIDVKPEGKSGKVRRILLDPGIYSLEQHDKISHADIVLITHEHADHFHIESLKALLKRAPDVSIITSSAVGEILAKEGIEHNVMRGGESVDIKDIHIEAYGGEHALTHKSIPLVPNIGFMIENKFFFPGDSLTSVVDSKGVAKNVDVLALPVSGTWLKLGEAIDYALQIKPRLAFPVHDVMRIPAQHKIPERILGQNGIEFIKLEEGGEIDV